MPSSEPTAATPSGTPVATPPLDADILANDGPFAAIDALLGAGTIEAVVSYHVTNGRRAANSVLPPGRPPRSRTIQTL